MAHNSCHARRWGRYDLGIGGKDCHKRRERLLYLRPVVDGFFRVSVFRFFRVK